MRAYAAACALTALVVCVPAILARGDTAAALFCGSALAAALGLLGLSWWLDRRGY